MIKPPEPVRLPSISERFQIYTAFSQGLTALQLLQSGLTLEYVHSLTLGMTVMLSGPFCCCYLFFAVFFPHVIPC